MGWGNVATVVCGAESTSAWSNVAESVCNSQSSSDALMEEADALCSDSDGETLPEPRPGYSGKIWWARLLEQHSRALGFQTPEAKQEIRVVAAQKPRLTRTRRKACLLLLAASCC